LFMGYHQSS